MGVTERLEDCSTAGRLWSNRQWEAQMWRRCISRRRTIDVEASEMMQVLCSFFLAGRQAQRDLGLCHGQRKRSMLLAPRPRVSVRAPLRTWIFVSQRFFLRMIVFDTWGSPRASAKVFEDFRLVYSCRSP